MGHADLGGQLFVTLDDFNTFGVGKSLRLIDAVGGITGQFSDVVLPTLAVGGQWALNYDSTGVTLKHESGALTPSSADFNHDDIIDGADFLLWQANYGGAGPEGDADFNHAVDDFDLAIWQSEFGQNPTLEGITAVPEPSGFALAVLAVVALVALA